MTTKPFFFSNDPQQEKRQTELLKVALANSHEKLKITVHELSERTAAVAEEKQQLDAQYASLMLLWVVVWCGVVWCGVVWRGVVWCGVVWCGVVC